MCLSFHKALGLKQASKLNLTDHLAEASNQFLPRSNLIHHGLKYDRPKNYNWCSLLLKQHSLAHFWRKNSSHAPLWETVIKSTLQDRKSTVAWDSDLLAMRHLLCHCASTSVHLNVFSGLHSGTRHDKFAWSRRCRKNISQMASEHFACKRKLLEGNFFYLQCLLLSRWRIGVPQKDQVKISSTESISSL